MVKDFPLAQSQSLSQDWSVFGERKGGREIDGSGGVEMDHVISSIRVKFEIGRVQSAQRVGGRSAVTFLSASLTQVTSFN
jgi:hypothetical protein